MKAYIDKDNFGIQIALGCFVAGWGRMGMHYVGFRDYRITWTKKPLFSVRNGYVKSLKLLGYYIRAYKLK